MPHTALLGDSIFNARYVPAGVAVIGHVCRILARTSHTALLAIG